MTTIIPVPAFRDNYVWVLRNGGLAAVVDPGDAAPVLDYLRRESLALCGILATHHHKDHVGGVPDLLRHASVPVWGPAREDIPGRTHAVAEEDVVEIAPLGVTLRVLDIPGHTAGHVAYVGQVAGRETMFCGDTLFAAGCGRVFEGTAEQMWASLSKLAARPADARIYCGHEYTLANLRFAAAVEPRNAAIDARVAREQARRDRGEPTLPALMSDELETNPFLRAGRADVRAAAEAAAGERLAGEVATFAALRAWKNRF